MECLGSLALQCSVLAEVLDATVNDWLVAKGDQVMTKIEDEAASFISHIFS